MKKFKPSLRDFKQLETLKEDLEFAENYDKGLKSLQEVREVISKFKADKEKQKRFQRNKH